MLKEQNNSSDRKFRGQSFQKGGIQVGLFDVFEPRRNGQQNFDRVLVGTELVASTIKPSSDGENNYNKSITKDTDEEKETCCEWGLNKELYRGQNKYLGGGIFSPSAHRKIELSKGTQGQLNQMLHLVWC